jgi:hypothetical protein
VPAGRLRGSVDLCTRIVERRNVDESIAAITRVLPPPRVLIHLVFALGMEIQRHLGEFFSPSAISQMGNFVLSA